MKAAERSVDLQKGDDGAAERSEKTYKKRPAGEVAEALSRLPPQAREVC
jgi:DNA-directed RNA polymerase specialized sigma24 family protein